LFGRSSIGSGFPFQSFCSFLTKKIGTESPNAKTKLQHKICSKMKTIQLSDKDLEQLKGLIDLFKEIDGDEDKSLELEDFYRWIEVLPH
jgi:hypothetical protein